MSPFPSCFCSPICPPQHTPCLPAPHIPHPRHVMQVQVQSSMEQWLRFLHRTRSIWGKAFLSQPSPPAPGPRDHRHAPHHGTHGTRSADLDFLFQQHKPQQSGLFDKGVLNLLPVLCECVRCGRRHVRACTHSHARLQYHVPISSAVTLGRERRASPPLSSSPFLALLLSPSLTLSASLLLNAACAAGAWPSIPTCMRF